jgi:hypothetical protein
MAAMPIKCHSSAWSQRHCGFRRAVELKVEEGEGAIGVVVATDNEERHGG